MSQKNIHTQHLNQTPFSQFKPIFSTLCAPDIHALYGIYRAEFTGPAWLRKSAGPSLALAGMGGWCGKEFYADGTAVNLVSHGGQIHRVFPMRLVTLPSLVDGKPGMTVQYIQGCPFPWPYIIDELRRLDENCLLGLTIINVGILRKLAFPFCCKRKSTHMDYDVIVVGSGFGGSVAALRFSEKGYRVAVLEQGRRVKPEDMQQANRSLAHLFWAPALGLRGFFTQTFFQHVTIVGGVGVGGGSLVYAAVLLEPEKQFFDDPAWNSLGVDWQAELKTHYETAGRMLGRVDCPVFHQMDETLRCAAETLGAAQSFGRAPLGIYFGEPGVSVPDPYFGGRGPARTGCDESGTCLTGCAHNAKNSLDLNYLYLAESLGAEILPEHKVTLIRPLAGGGYELEMVNPLDRKRKYAALRAEKVVLAAGVLGTLTLLFRCRDELKTLPEISAHLGETVRTNSESIVAILPHDPHIDLSKGPTISSHFYYTNHTHITQNRFPAGYTFMKWYSGPLVDEMRPLRRAFKTILAFLLHPLRSTASWRARNWHRREIVLTVMQSQDNRLSFRYGRGLFSLFGKSLQSKTNSGKRAPTYLPEANQAARACAQQVDGIPQNTLLESLLNMSTTAHILGGCPIGRDRDSGVIDSGHQVFGYAGLYVVDGSAIPANVGVNPSLTITALAERFMSKIPAK